MKVFILKEGKEYNQGVAYLDDGTMVVIDNARRLIGKTIDVVVTSVLQTTAGKMIFGRHIDTNAQQAPAGPPPVAQQRPMSGAAATVVAAASPAAAQQEPAPAVAPPVEKEAGVRPSRVTPSA
jgi:hypothetical protein